MTYNVQLQGLFQEEQLRKEKENGIINFLRSKHPNILCMQEFRASSGAPYKFLKIIKDTISSKNYYFQRYFKDSKNSYGLAIYSDYSIINKQILKDDNNRVYSISVDLKVSSDTIRVFNTHFESNRLQNKELKLFKDIKNINKRKISDGIQIILSKLKKAYRNRVPQINRLIEAIKNSPYPVVLCGDFNEPPSSWAYHNISKYLKDSFIEKGFGTGITYNGYIPMLRIDYIFTSDNIKVDMVESHKIPYSDHYPQSAWISLEKN
ncbi:MAG: endonuclease/exonuclease/phosphatase family protein [Hyphomicrobiales bacterium]